MSSVGINPPKTPATKGSRGIAKATLPNVCKMPGPPAPFVPAPLPNIAKSGMSPKGYSKKVKIEGNTVAIRGATFKSMGDVASKGTGGGLISANTHGIAKFITPGSMNVKIEGKSVHLLGEPMLNNCGASGSPPNTGSTMTGLDQGDATGAQLKAELKKLICECNRKVNDEERKNIEQKKKETRCSELGTKKHKCVDDKIKEKQFSQIDEEKGYSKHGGLLSKKRQALPKKASPGSVWPDCSINHANGDRQFVELKFKCTEGTAHQKKKNGRWTRTKPVTPDTWTSWSRGQKEKQKRLSKQRAKKEGRRYRKPMLINNKGCGK